MKIVTKETAILAKENGLDIECLYFYINPNTKMYSLDEYNRPFLVKSSNMLYNCNEYRVKNVKAIIPAPYQYQLIDWLREEHKIFVTIFPFRKSSLDVWEGCVWIYPLNENKEIIGSAMHYNFGAGLPYNECLETALQEALKLIVL